MFRFPQTKNPPIELGSTLPVPSSSATGRARLDLLTLSVSLVILTIVSGALWSFAFRQSANSPTAQQRSRTSEAKAQPRLVANQSRRADLVLIPEGTVQIGDNNGPPSERPAFRYSSHAFLMDRSPVTVAQFAAFLKDTGYKTDAERYGSAGVLDEKQGRWVAVEGATWRHPNGPKGPLSPADHPVTQVSWFDANAFCSAYGLRLPTEFEWERAARIGQTPDGHVFKLNDSIKSHGRYLVNAWEGSFPLLDTGADGYRTTSPVGRFGTAPSGLTDMAGNVWEWTSSWYLPYGAPQQEPTDGQGERVARGGSFLCSQQFCQGYRASARNHTTPDTSLENIGFRCAADPGQITAVAGRIENRPAQIAATAHQQFEIGGKAQ